MEPNLSHNRHADVSGRGSLTAALLAQSNGADEGDSPTTHTPKAPLLPRAAERKRGCEERELRCGTLLTRDAAPAPPRRPRSPMSKFRVRARFA